MATVQRSENMMSNIRKQLVADRESRVKFNLVKQKVEADQNKVKLLKEMNEISSKVTKNNRLQILVEEEM
jgi:hypothetical protein